MLTVVLVPVPRRSMFRSLQGLLELQDLLGDATEEIDLARHYNAISVNNSIFQARKRMQAVHPRTSGCSPLGLDRRNAVARSASADALEQGSGSLGR